MTRYFGDIMRSKPLIWIGSLQYRPIFKSHCCALGKQCEKNGFLVNYLFCRDYEWMLSKNQKDNTIFIGSSNDILSSIKDGFNIKNYELLKEKIIRERPQYIYMYNFHPFFNYYLAKLAKKYNIIYIYHFHEPFAENKQVFGDSRKYWLHLFEHYQERLLAYTNIVILSSDRARILFEKRYKNYTGKILQIPLIYEDFGGGLDKILERKYITFIGPPVASKSPETFLRIANKSRDLKHEFLLITRREVRNPQYLNSNVNIFYKEKITDFEIGEFLRRSVMTVTPYKVSNQSSVILTSFMYGTPVLSTNVGGIPEFVTHMKTGYLLDLDASIEEWIEGLNYIYNNLSFMSYQCRTYFTERHSESNWAKYMEMIFHK